MYLYTFVHDKKNQNFQNFFLDFLSLNSKKTKITLFGLG